MGTELCKIQAHTNEKQTDYYFFSRKDKKYPTGNRANRATTKGFWKATGRDKPIYTKLQTLIGMRKTLVFYEGRAPHGVKTDWIMHEFRLDDGPGMPAHVSFLYPPRIFSYIASEAVMGLFEDLGLQSSHWFQFALKPQDLYEEPMIVCLACASAFTMMPSGASRRSCCTWTFCKNYWTSSRLVAGRRRLGRLQGIQEKQKLQDKDSRKSLLFWGTDWSASRDGLPWHPLQGSQWKLRIYKQCIGSQTRVHQPWRVQPLCWPVS